MGLKDAVTRGHAIALVHNVSHEYTGFGRLAVQRASDLSVPDRLFIGLGADYCRFDIDAHEVGAIALERRDGQWRKVVGSQIALRDAIRHLDGEPASRSAQTPVAAAVGRFDGARMATLDRNGQIVAWDRRPGPGIAAAACPGGARIVSVGGTRKKALELSVHDARTLAVLRSVALPDVGPVIVTAAYRPRRPVDRAYRRRRQPADLQHVPERVGRQRVDPTRLPVRTGRAEAQPRRAPAGRGRVRKRCRGLLALGVRDRDRETLGPSGFRLPGSIEWTRSGGLVFAAVIGPAGVAVHRNLATLPAG